MRQLVRHTGIFGRKDKQRPKVVCPQCGSAALNKYGRVKSGKQRFLCLVCNRQFCWPSSVKPIPLRPTCPECGKPMHIYVRESKKVRFRCRDYPHCRQYAIVNLQTGKDRKFTG